MTEHVTDENQLSTSDSRLYAHQDCGLCCALGMALDAGLPSDETVASMERWYTAHGDTPSDGTGLPVNAAWLQQEGLDAESFFGGMDVVDGYLDQGFRVQLAIYSNHYGQPYSGVGSTGHFLELCWRDASTGQYHTMQPVGGYETSYTRQALATNSQDCGIVVKHNYKGPGVTGVTMGGVHMGLNAPIVRSLATPDGKGALDIAEDGGVFPWGSVPGFGALTNTPHNGTVVSGALYMPKQEEGDFTVTGYWLLASDGGVWPFGAAPGFGSLGNVKLNKPAVDIVPGPDGKGYGIKCADGGWWPFQQASVEGSEA